MTESSETGMINDVTVKRNIAFNDKIVVPLLNAVCARVNADAVDESAHLANVVGRSRPARGVGLGDDGVVRFIWYDENANPEAITKSIFLYRNSGEPAQGTVTGDDKLIVYSRIGQSSLKNLTSRSSLYHV